MLWKPKCDHCGELAYGWMDGYGVGDRLLEGVRFQIANRDGELAVRTDPKHERYMANLNEQKWLKIVQDAAESEDTLQCPKCGDDIDGPAAEES